MFRGTFEHTIDEKGRIAVPMRYREVLQGLGDDRLIITNFFFGSAKCLDVFPHDQWVKLEESLAAKPQFNQRILWFQQYYVSAAQECVVDKQGRVLMPPGLRSYAGLEKDVVFTPAFSKFRMWSRETWRQVHGEAERGLMENPEQLSELGI